MDKNRYTVSLYIAKPGGRRFDPHNKTELEPSGVGHVYYSISNDGGKTEQGYGFSPKKVRQFIVVM